MLFREERETLRPFRAILVAEAANALATRPRWRRTTTTSRCYAKSRSQGDDAKLQIVLRRGEPLLPGLGAPEQTRVGHQKAFEHSDLAHIELPLGNPGEFEANIFEVRREGLPRRRERTQVQIQKQVEIAGEAVVMLLRRLGARVIRRRHDQLMDGGRVVRVQQSVAQKQFRAVPHILEVGTLSAVRRLRHIDGVVPKDGRRDQRRPGGQRLKPVQLLQQFRDMLPTVIGAARVGIAAVERVPRRGLVACLERSPMFPCDLVEHRGR